MERSRGLEVARGAGAATRCRTAETNSVAARAARRSLCIVAARRVPGVVAAVPAIRRHTEREARQQVGCILAQRPGQVVVLISAAAAAAVATVAIAAVRRRSAAASGGRRAAAAGGAALGAL